MAKKRTVFTCQQCGYESAKFMGKCPECSEWNSFVETTAPSKQPTASSSRQSAGATPVKLEDIQHSSVERLSTGISELDYVLGGGIVPGQVILLAGEPGVGKSTLLLQLVKEASSQQSTISNQQNTPNSKFQIPNSTILYVSGEESPEQISLRAKRLGVERATGARLQLYAETNIENVIRQTASGKQPPAKTAKLQITSYKLLIVDSIQTMWSENLSGAPGSVGQVRECAYKLIQAAKQIGLPVIVVGQVTKEGSIAGPKVLEHLVDTVLYLEGARFEETRLLRVSKNRFGPTDEVGVFTMDENGLSGLSNPSDSFITKRDSPVSGQATAVVLEGTRPIVVEVQALVAPSELSNPRRVGNGVNFNRLLMLTAILSKHLRLPLERFDVYVNVSGGLRIDEPGADLAIALAIYSSMKNKPLPAKSAAIGELSLLGEIQPAMQKKRREKEAKKLGFTAILSEKKASSLASLVSRMQ